MNRLQTTVCLVGTLVIAALIAPPSFAADGATAPPKGFTALFNGKDLSGWWGLKTEDPRKWKALTPEKLAEKRAASIQDLNKHWSAKDGVLYNRGSGLYLSTIKEYGDFELLVDYNMVAGGDSGIYLRGIPQVQIWDYTKEGGKWNLGADKGSGGLWNNAKDSPGKDPLVLADKPFGQWNAFRIIMVGDKVTVFLNGKLVVDHATLRNFFDKKNPAFKTGTIQLQTHGKPIKWRNVFIREIGAEEADKILREGGVEKKADARFKSLFNGKDLAGWAGPV